MIHLPPDQFYERFLLGRIEAVRLSEQEFSCEGVEIRTETKGLATAGGRLPYRILDVELGLAINNTVAPHWALGSDERSRARHVNTVVWGEFEKSVLARVALFYKGGDGGDSVIT